MINELERVVLTGDLPDEGLKSGDVGTVVLAHKQGKAYEVEFLNLAGETVAVATVDAALVRRVTKRDISHSRRLAAA